MRLILPLVLSLISLNAFAMDRPYCGTIECSDATDGCQVNDGQTNPIVLWNAPEGAHLSKAMQDKLNNLECGCVVGEVALDQGRGPTITYFKTVSNAYSVPASRCGQ